LMLGGYGIYHFSINNTRPQAQNTSPKGDQPNDKHKTDHSKNEENNKETIAIKPTMPSKHAEHSKKFIVVATQKPVVRAIKKNKIIASVSKPNSVAQDQTTKSAGQPERKESYINNTKQETATTSSLNTQPGARDTAQKEIAKPGNEDLTHGDTAGSKWQQSKDATSVQTVNKKKGDNGSRKLSWGINFSAGTSVITEDAFSFKSSYAADRQYSIPGSNSGGPLTGGGGGGPVPYSNYPQSQNKPAFAFKAGINARKNISKRSSLSAGVGYAYLADKIKVGAGQSQVQSQTAFSFSYYTGSPQQTYTDHFHFIEFPLNYNWRVTNNADHFLSLNAGISPSWLLSTNALIYDTAFGGVYYHNKDLVTKTHFNFISGISYQFRGKKNLEFVIGPQFSFDMTEVFKSNLDKRKYLLFTGVGATIFFDKKKK